jgi:hypothetical protein
MPPPKAASSRRDARMLRHLLRRAGMPHMRTHASIVPAAAKMLLPPSFGPTSAAVVGAVVATVSVAVTAVDPVMLTGLEVPKLKVGRS